METSKQKNCQVIKFNKNKDMDSYTYDVFNEKYSQMLNVNDKENIITFEGIENDFIFSYFTDDKNYSFLKFVLQQDLVEDFTIISSDFTDMNFFSKEDIKELSTKVMKLKKYYMITIL
jgi:hypothetical protein